MGMTSLSIAASGLNAAQTGLYVTGHNMANSGTEGYARQRPVQTDFFYTRAGENNLGVLQKGLGADIKGIVQLRDRFLDAAYRLENSRLGFYAAKSGTGVEIESIIGETESQYSFQSVAIDLWDALNELTIHPEGLETRGNFIAMADSFITKASDIYNRLFEYQHNLNDQIITAVGDANNLISQIEYLNRKIVRAAATGDNPNDYRDQRSVCMDKLSKILPAAYKEQRDSAISITCEGKELLANGLQKVIGLKYVSKEYSFVEPVLSSGRGVLPASAPLNQFEPLFTFTEPVNAEYGNDYGSLKGLMISRGTRPTTYQGVNALATPAPSDPAGQYRYRNDMYSQENCFIPQVMRDIDLLVHGIVTLINDSLAPALNGARDPGAPYDLENRQSYTEVFSRKTMPRWGAGNSLIPEIPNNYYTLYTIGNIEVNPEILRPGGVNLLALSMSGDRDDNRLPLELIRQWNNRLADANGNIISINDGYKHLLTSISTETSKNLSFLKEQSLLTEQTNDKRSRIMSVSLDEELKNMMIYQHAYSAAARILNIIDSMLERIINVGA